MTEGSHPVVGRARFDGAEFIGHADFSGVNFVEAASFSQTRFRRPARFARTQFRGEAKFTQSEFPFEEAVFEHPELGAAGVSGCVHHPRRLVSPVERFLGTGENPQG